MRFIIIDDPYLIIENEKGKYAAYLSRYSYFPLFNLIVFDEYKEYLDEIEKIFKIYLQKSYGENYKHLDVKVFTNK